MVSMQPANAIGLTLSTSISRSTLLALTSSSKLPRLINLMATCTPYSVCTPSLTLPNSPSPSVCSKTYGPKPTIGRLGCA